MNRAQSQIEKEEIYTLSEARQIIEEEDNKGYFREKIKGKFIAIVFGIAFIAIGILSLIVLHDGTIFPFMLLLGVVAMFCSYTE